MRLLNEDGCKRLFYAVFASEPCSERIAEIADVLGTMLYVLPYRQKRVLRLRYGLSGSKPKLLREIGVELKLCGERVRSIENCALANLRRIASSGYRMGEITLLSQGTKK